MQTAPSVLDAKILIVDDQLPNVLLLEKMLQAQGYRNVLSTTDPRQAEPLYLTHRFDLILLDLNMPVMDGFAVIQRLREVEEHFLSIVVLTAQHDTESRVRALQSGAKDFIAKPFERLETLTRIRNLLELKLSDNQIRRYNQRLEQLVRERTREVVETRLQIIRRLGRAAEMKDNETGQHILRMSQISELLARAASLDDDTCELILTASPMHDIGKIGIPDRILLKPGKLDADEWAIMQTHTTIGAELLADGGSDLINAAHIIALSHHEKWDGSGYPQGLKGEDIPLFGRIVAVADVFDALVSARPYKQPWAVDEAVGYVCEQAGKHFDPNIARLFADNVEEILAIHRQHADPERLTAPHTPPDTPQSP